MTHVRIYVVHLETSGELDVVTMEPSTMMTISCKCLMTCRWWSVWSTWRQSMSGSGLDRSSSTASLWCRKCMTTSRRERNGICLLWVDTVSFVYVQVTAAACFISCEQMKKGFVLDLGRSHDLMKMHQELRGRWSFKWDGRRNGRMFG